MTLFGLVIKEMARRRLGLVLSILSAVVATAVFVSYQTISSSSQDALRASMLKMGHNIVIVPKGAPKARLWTAEFGTHDMPEADLAVLASSSHIDVDHYMAALQKRVALGDGKVVAIVTGVRCESVAANPAETATLGFRFGGPNDAHLGYEVAQALGRQVGDTLDVDGRTFTAAAVREHGGTVDDIRVYVPLETAQAMWGKAGRIDAIFALGRVGRSAGDPLKAVREQLTKAMNGRAQVIVMKDAFQTRDRSRRMLGTMGFTVSVVLMVLCGLGLALYVYHNVTDRTYETAVLVALGFRPKQVVLALLSKVIVVGVAAGVGGMLVGTAIAAAAGPSIFAVTSVPPVWGLWWQALAFAVVLCLAAAAVAVWGAIRAAPADVLRNQ